jgi:uncharacterized protein YndB with AHSA1/START domain
MKTRQFQLASRWRVQGSVDEVYQILSEPEAFVRWWPAVYLQVSELTSGDDDGVGRVISLHTKGWLPYTLTWQARVLEVDKPQRIVIEAQGDLHGHGEWRFTQDGDWVDIEYDWTVITTKPWMIYLMPLLKPVFTANHRWAMKQGEAGLRRELMERNRSG